MKYNGNIDYCKVLKIGKPINIRFFFTCKPPGKLFTKKTPLNEFCGTYMLLE